MHKSGLYCQFLFLSTSPYSLTFEIEKAGLWEEEKGASSGRRRERIRWCVGLNGEDSMTGSKFPKSQAEILPIIYFTSLQLRAGGQQSWFSFQLVCCCRHQWIPNSLTIVFHSLWSKAICLIWSIVRHYLFISSMICFPQVFFAAPS